MTSMTLPNTHLDGRAVNLQLDRAVITGMILPKDCKVTAFVKHGSSTFGAETYRIDTKQTDENMASFLKVLFGENTKQMAIGEFESTKAIHDIIPVFTPRPIASGPYESHQEKHFLLFDFRDMTGQQLSPDEFAANLATMHQQSKSSHGKFGSHVTTFPGNLPQVADWEDSWEVFFAESLRLALDLEICRKGPDSELGSLVQLLFDRVIPRLLRPLETDGRTIKPSLVHGDLWYGNAGVDAGNNTSLIFDACCFYAHNEYEFGQWRPACNRFGNEYLEEYHKYVEKSAPEEDYDGRLDLYKLRFNTHVSALFPENKELRDQIVGDIRDLVKRFGGHTP